MKGKAEDENTRGKSEGREEKGEGVVCPQFGGQVGCLPGGERLGRESVRGRGVGDRRRGGG